MVRQSARRSAWHAVLSALPAFNLIFIVLLGTAPLGAWFWPEIGPMITLMAIFFWATDHSNALSYWAVFCVGILLDILTGNPLGGYALVLLIIAGMTETQRRIFSGKPFYISWLGLAVISLTGLTVAYVINSIYHFHLFDPRPVIGQWIVCVLLYPLIAFLLGFIRIQITRTMGDHP